MDTSAMTVGGTQAAEATRAVGEAAPVVEQPRHQTIRSDAVIILERDGSLVRCGPKPHPPDIASGYAELSVQSIRQQSSLIDRVLDFAFDTLGLTVLELRVSERE
jgi:hypothetical protein